MRIVAGKYRHRKLLSNAGMTTRPITDRAKVMLFDRIQNLIPDARVTDIFSGTGSMGLEALSRGAQSVVFIEQDRDAFELLKENVRHLKAESETLCWRTNALRSSFRPRGAEEKLPFDLVFFDPPYRMIPRIRPGAEIFTALERLGSPNITAEGAWLFLRCDVATEFEMPACWELDETVRSGSMALHIFRKAPEVPLDATQLSET